jgi:molybdate transport system regulatory protein
VSKRANSFSVRLRIDLESGGSLGPGKIALLEHIAGSGSLSQAARELGMSYRRAWLLLDDMNRAFAEPATTSSIGGAGGGGAQLTEFGRQLVRTYREVEEGASDMAGARFAWLTREAVTADPQARLPRRRLSRPGTGTRARAAKRS